MAETKLIENMSDFLEYNHLIHLVKDQMEYIQSPKTNEQIMGTFRLAFENDNAHLLVISDNGYPVGFLFFNVSIGMESAGKYLWLNEMHVHSQYRNHGYGSMLFDSLKEWCRENKVLRIMGMADESEKRTLNFYKKQGCNTYQQEIFSIYLD